MAVLVAMLSWRVTSQHTYKDQLESEKRMEDYAEEPFISRNRGKSHFYFLPYYSHFMSKRNLHVTSILTANLSNIYKDLRINDRINQSYMPRVAKTARVVTWAESDL